MVQKKCKPINFGPPIKKASFLDILDKRRARRKKIKGIEYHYSDYCIHVGKISYGCITCFNPSLYSYSALLGNKCNLRCNYCFAENLDKPELPESFIDDSITAHFRESLYPDYGEKGKPYGFAFTDNEPLLYMKRLKKYMKALKEIEEKKKTRPYYKLYTNGLLANKENLKTLKEIGIHELRFHPSASNFSKEVYKNMEEAVKMGFIVAVEEPSYPKNKKKLMEMLPIIEKIGVKHLQMCVVEVYPNNMSAIFADHPNGLFYHDHLFHLYDEGLVYDIMEEVIKKKYNFSVLDCGPESHRIQKAPSKMIFPPGNEKDIEETFFNPFI